MTKTLMMGGHFLSLSLSLDSGLWGNLKGLDGYVYEIYDVFEENFNGR